MKPNSPTEPIKPVGGLVNDAFALTLMQKHLRIGWWSLLLFLTFGLFLEALHGFKAGLYLDVSNSTRRLMWTLAHAHGTLLSLVHIAFGVTLSLVPRWDNRFRDLASVCLIGAGILIPGGFFLGGLVIYSGDPGLGILLLPLGALLLFTAVLLTARGVQASRTDAAAKSADGKKKK